MEEYPKFKTLPIAIRVRLLEICDSLYESDDCTPLAEIAARAYLLGKADNKEIQ